MNFKIFDPAKSHFWEWIFKYLIQPNLIFGNELSNIWSNQISFSRNEWNCKRQESAVQLLGRQEKWGNANLPWSARIRQVTYKIQSQKLDLAAKSLETCPTAECLGPTPTFAWEHTSTQIVKKKTMLRPYQKESIFVSSKGPTVCMVIPHKGAIPA